ncbi:hypothetical protein LCL95_04480 [Bacillus timonensis]|nr:hypothetical protein [Bacillus timonensis]
MQNAKELLHSYRQLWNNRLLTSSDENSWEILVNAISIDLKDELTHPRVRKSIHKKFSMAIKRISESNLPEKEKLELIHLHIVILEDLEDS